MYYTNLIILFTDVAAEKTQKAFTEALIEGVEGFDTNKLKPTETLEKNPLPDKTGEYSFEGSCNV